ncbi:MAG: hypothetical protein AMJ95_07140 [Omnitrophica WOR_2 bacterium SM23_72]|nr:MAG: hypothetical protein AMJ95_07140 [Omnitrophica WOR_2 bacterium SM23_72]
MKAKKPWIKNRARCTGICVKVLFLSVFLVSQDVWASGNAQSPAPVQEREEAAGQLFGVEVPMKNYRFVENVVKVFGNRWGDAPKNEEQFHEVIWEQLLLSFLAFNQNINPTQEELEEEITRTLEDEKVTFDWKQDRSAYEQWAKQKTGDSVELFENQLRHLIQLQKLRDKIMDSIKPEVFDKDELQKFSDQNSFLNLEMVSFKKQQEAEEFFLKVSGRPDIWERQKKRRSTDFRQTGLVSLESLMGTWKIPLESARRMLQRDVGEIYPPRHLGETYAVFKILEKKLADESQFPGASDPYYVDLIKKKKQEGLNVWLKQLKEQAHIKIYNREGGKA